MNSGELHAWHYATRQPVRVVWRAGKITAVDTTAENPPGDIWVAPPLLDLQINGYAGVDFQQDTLAEDELLHAVRGLRRDACTGFFLTLITDDWERMMGRLQNVSAILGKNPEIAAAVRGIHLEGPFLSPEPGFCGAHDPHWMIPATAGHLDEARKFAGQLPLLLTVAPECHGVAELAEAAAQDPLTFMNAGHTNARAGQLLLRSHGHPAFTHLGNGCPQALDRHDNILWRALDLEALWISLIPDGRHVSPALFRILHRLKGNHIYYTTDAMSAAGAGRPGKYRLGKLELEVKDDGIVRFPGRTNFAGSALTPIAGVFRAAEMLRCDWQHAWKFLSETPAQRLGWDNSLRPGPADFCRLEPGRSTRGEADGTVRLTTYAAGVPCENSIAAPEDGGPGD